MNRSIGVDLSVWDWMTWNWKEASSLIDFVFVKASEGTVPDPRFPDHWPAARGWVLRGGYHFFRPSVDPNAAAVKFAEILAPDPGELPPVLDLEATDGQADTLSKARTFAARLEQEIKLRPIIYSTRDFMRSIGAWHSILGIYTQRWLLNYLFWEAQYPGDNLKEPFRDEWIGQILRREISIVYPGSPPPWKTIPDWHQWTGKAKPQRIPGAYIGTNHKKAIDVNFYKGTREELFARYGTPHLRNGVNTMPFQFNITPSTQDGSKVRLNHFTSSAQIGSLAFGRLAFGDSKWTAPADAPDGSYKAGDTWLEVKEVNGEAMIGWIAETHKGVRYATITATGYIPPTDPDPDPGEEVAEITLKIPGYKAVTLTIPLEPE